MRGATQGPLAAGHGRADFNPHSPCGERPVSRLNSSAGGIISIHTPHAGSDTRPVGVITILSDFNPHSPCGERPQTAFTCLAAGTFQSTLPMRGATIWIVSSFSHASISIHTPHAGSDPAVPLLRHLPLYISIHTPHAGSDPAARVGGVV